MEQRTKKLLPDDFIGDQVREIIRRKHYSFRTEKSNAAWIRRYIHLGVIFLKIYWGLITPRASSPITSLIST